MPDLLPYQSDVYAVVSALTDNATGAFVNDATVTITLFTKRGTAIAGATDLPATYIASSQGQYRATIPRTAAVTLGTTYDCRARAVKSGFETMFWQEVVVQKLSA